MTQIILTVSICMVAGLLVTRLVRLLNLPDVTAYLIAGVLVGTFCLGGVSLGGYYFGYNAVVFEQQTLHVVFDVICDVALGFIAFAIGSEFRWSQLKKTGKEATVIGIIQAVVATLMVDAALIGMHFLLLYTTGKDILPLPAAILLGAIASATAPAATLMVVRQYKAKGPLTSILLPIVALDDAVGLVLFAVSAGVAKAMISGEVSILSIVVEPLLEIVLSLVLGAVIGFALTFAENLFHSNSNRLSLSIAFVFVTVAASMLHFEIGGVHVGFSSLLTCMMMGTVFCNFCPCSEEMMERTDKWTKPIFILFFVLSGAELDLSVFLQPIFILIGVVYILFRSLGKYFGALGSSALMRSDPTIQKYLGITLLPQAGVALGMVTTVCADASLAGVSNTVRFVVLFAVLVYEIFGPVLTKWALTRAGDITAKPEGKTARRHNASHLHKHAK
ncbi:MAG: cation:proton antiporter [Clostridia bacterium]|nr:cation:proton antiporter [Clostridia bacterium]